MDQGYIVTTTIKIGIVPRTKKIKTWHKSLERAKQSIEFAKKREFYKNSIFKISRPGEGLIEII
jgi:hypothetical protein